MSFFDMLGNMGGIKEAVEKAREEAKNQITTHEQDDIRVVVKGINEIQELNLTAGFAMLDNSEQETRLKAVINAALHKAGETTKANMAKTLNDKVPGIGGMLSQFM